MSFKDQVKFLTCRDATTIYNIVKGDIPAYRDHRVLITTLKQCDGKFIQFIGKKIIGDGEFESDLIKIETVCEAIRNLKLNNLIDDK